MASRVWHRAARAVLHSYSGGQRPLVNKRPIFAVRLASTSVAKEYIVTSPEPPITLPSGNYSGTVLQNSDRWQDRVALECTLTGCTTTYAQLRDQAARWGGFLLKQGLTRGDVVAVVSPNVNEFTPIMYGTTAVGGVITGMNPTYSAEEIAFQLADSNAKLVVVFAPFEPLVRAALALCKKDLPIVNIGIPTDSPLPTATGIFNDDRIPFADTVEVSGQDPVAIMYSSGTTGKPKGTVLSHDNCSANLAMITHPTFLLPGAHTTDEFQHTLLMLLPMFHVAGLFGVNAAGIHMGAKLVNYAKFDPETFLQVVTHHKISVLHLVPALLNFLVAHPECDADKLRHVQAILCGTAPMSETALAALFAKVARPVIFQQAYGMTELLFVTVDPINEVKAGYTGKLLPGVQAKVLDLTDGVTTLPAHQDGEICIKSPAQMVGYLNNPEVTALTVDKDGWLHTGDVGHYDDKGYFKIVDRTKELVKVKGLQVSPSEVEEVVMQVEGVVEVSVVGVPHDRLGEAPRAYVVAKDVTADKITEHVEAKLAKYKHLAGGVVFLDSLPRNTTGKVLKKQLQKMAREEQ